MKSKALFILLLIAAIGLPVFAQQRQYLHDGWTFRQSRLTNSYPAKVPGVVHTDLMRQGLIADPYLSLNERGVQWVDKEDWDYETTFRLMQNSERRMQNQAAQKNNSAFKNTNSAFCNLHSELNFDGLDTYADVYLNDSLILSADNMFRRWRVDVSSLLKAGDNKLRVHFHSPIKVDMPKWEKHPYMYRGGNDQSENGGVLDRHLSVFARKAGYHYGWDWGPRLVTSGIWRSVYLESWTDLRIADTHIRQREVSKQKALVTDVVTVEADEAMDNATITVTDNGSGRTLATRKCTLKKGINTIPIDITIRNPRLWWCNGLGKPELYTFTTKVSIGGKTISQKEDRVGLRSVKLVTDLDSQGKHQFYFVLNGVPVFAKGTNYIPQDNFLPDVTPERHRQTLQDAVDANMNMVRVWGGGIYEDDVFYDLCDEMGLMVWQDFMFACSTYPAEGEWLENVRQEAVDNIRRLRNHPSIVIWCGGNECMDAWYNWGWKRTMEQTNPDQASIVEKQQEHLYYDVLQEIAAKEIPDDNYSVGSPYSLRGRGGDGVNGDRHFYGVGHRRMPVSSYNKEEAHFFSEYGMQSFPEYSTILRFAPDTATHHITSELMMSHQRGGVNANKVIEWYVNSEYGEPHDFRQFLYASQLLQADAMRTAIEAHRRNMPHCMGSLLWQHDDCWPVASWATRDYYGNWKAAHYAVRRAFEPLLCSAITSGDTLQVYAVSDYLQKQQATLAITVYSLDGRTVNSMERKVVVPANTSTLLLEQPLQQLLQGEKRENVVVSLELKTASAGSCQANAFLCLPKDLNLQPVEPEITVTSADGGCVVTVKSDKFSRSLSLSVDGMSPQPRMSDNYFDLLPGVPVSVTVNTDLTPAELKERILIETLNTNH